MHRWKQIGIVAGLLWACGTGIAGARMAPIEPGTVKTERSDNGRYEIVITHRGQGIAEWCFKEDGRELWTDMMTGDPGGIQIADNGEAFVMSTWGWRDEGGSSGLAIYNKQGKLVREIPFGTDGVLKWVRAMAISPDGKYVAVGEDAKDGAQITLYDAAAGTEIWGKPAGGENIAEIKIAPQGAYVLAATHAADGQDMAFVLLNSSGDLVWQKKLPANYSWDVPRYLGFTPDKRSFEVYDLKSQTFLSEQIPAEKK